MIPLITTALVVLAVILVRLGGKNRERPEHRTESMALLSKPASSIGYGILWFDQPSPRWPQINLSGPRPETEGYLFMIFFTNALPPGLRSTIAISPSRKYEWHKAARDGSMSMTTRGQISTQLLHSLLAEWSAVTGETNMDRRSKQAVYVGASDGVHPPQVQKLLDDLSK